MKRLISILMIALPLLGLTQKPLLFYRGNTKLEKIHLAPPASFMFDINKGNRFQFDSALSEGTSRYLSAELQKGVPNSVSAVVFNTDSALKSRLGQFLIRVNNEFTKENRIEKYTLPDSILRLFDSSTTNYVLCTYHVGFNRTRENLLNKQQKNEIAAFLFGVSTPPYEFGSTMSLCILDLKEKSIFYFERDVTPNKDPTDVKVITMQLSRLIAHCFI